MKNQLSKTVIAGWISLAFTVNGTQADVTGDLRKLRDICLYYAVGHAPELTGRINGDRSFPPESTVSKTRPEKLALKAHCATL
jgi:hypothetical protein